MSKILFVINPIAGAKSHSSLVDIIKNQLPVSINAHFEIWESKEKFQSIKERILNEPFDIIVASGGDGTLSLISQLAMKVNTPLGILPVGSGNGYARHLRIPLNVNDAIKVILANKTIDVDTAEINNRYFINIAGLGFDALISQQFSKTKRRGIANYASLVFKNLFSYKPGFYRLNFNEQVWTGKAVVVDFALGTQYGNNVIISPLSDPCDGMIDICILEPYPFMYNIVLLYRFFTGSIHKSKYYKTFQSNRIKVTCSAESPAQYDGEAISVPSEFEVKISVNKLKVLVPEFNFET